MLESDESNIWLVVVGPTPSRSIPYIRLENGLGGVADPKAATQALICEETRLHVKLKDSLEVQVAFCPVAVALVTFAVVARL